MIENYKIIKEFNSGGQAETFLAEEISTSKKVVIKKLNVSKTKNWKTIELFERECKVLKNLNHKAIPAYIDSFHENKDNTEGFFLVQEYVNGVNLEEIIKSGRRFNISEIFQIIEKLFNILEYIHNLNPSLVHRDIKPSNIILTEDTEGIDIHLIDFGTVNKSIIGNIGGSTVVGTIGYMALEQLMGKSTPRSDLYSSGAVMLFLLTATHPEELPINDMQVEFEEHSAIKQLNNQNIISFLKNLINKNETQRYLNVESALSELKNLKNNIPIKTIGEVNKEEKTLKKNEKTKKIETFFYIGLIVFSIGLAAYIYLINFNSFSETRLIEVTPYWILPLSFGYFGATTSKPNRFLTATIRSVVIVTLLILFIHFIFPSM
jgi:serine/threonine protein kinase